MVMNNFKNKQGGFIQLIALIVVGFIILRYFHLTISDVLNFFHLSVSGITKWFQDLFTSVAR